MIIAVQSRRIVIIIGARDCEGSDSKSACRPLPRSVPARVLSKAGDSPVAVLASLFACQRTLEVAKSPYAPPEATPAGRHGHAAGSALGPRHRASDVMPRPVRLASIHRGEQHGHSSKDFRIKVLDASVDAAHGTSLFASSQTPRA